MDLPAGGAVSVSSLDLLLKLYRRSVPVVDETECRARLARCDGSPEAGEVAVGGVKDRLAFCLPFLSFVSSWRSGDGLDGEGL